jgi:hypothetical protein
MPSEPTLYVCKNEMCSLGSMKQPGRFTGGMTAAGKHLLTGDPLEGLVEGEDYGEGFCTNCGAQGEPYDAGKATAAALAEAEAQHKAHIAAIKEGVA